MMKRLHDQTTYWRMPEYGDMELLHARYVTHEFPPHFHEEYVIGVVEDGYHQFNAQGNLQTIGRYSIILINPGEVHGCYTDDAWYQYRCFYPGVTLMRQIAQEMTDSQINFPIFQQTVVKDATLAQQLMTLHRAMEHSKTRLIKDTLLREALGLLIQSYADDDKNPLAEYSDNQAVSIAQEYLQSHYADDVSLDNLASVTHYSPYHLSRIFKKTIGLPPHKYLIQIRLQRAKALLASGLPIADVAIAVGFADQSHLTKWFKRVVGVPPGQFVHL